MAFSRLTRHKKNPCGRKGLSEGIEQQASLLAMAAAKMVPAIPGRGRGLGAAADGGKPAGWVATRSRPGRLGMTGLMR